MIALSRLLASPSLKPLLSHATRARTDAPVERVALIEDFQDLSRVPPAAILLLSRAASASAGSYRFDVALRTLRERRTAAVVLASEDVHRVTTTAAAIAERSGTAILGTSCADLAQLAIAIARELEGDADAALLRAHAAVRAIAAHPAGAGLDALVAHAGATLGVPLDLSSAPPANGDRVAVSVDGPGLWVTAPSQHGDLGLALEIVLEAAASGVQRELSEAERAEELPIQSREDALTELLTAPQHGRPPIVQRARDLGMPVDGWHVAARLELESLSGVPVDAHHLRHGLSRLALSTLRGAGGTWNAARAGPALVLVRMHRQDPGGDAGARVAEAVDEALPVLRSRVPELQLRCGIGGAHAGPAGLLASVAEAHAALTAGRAAGRVNHAVPFDSLGLRRALVEWYASRTAQEAVASVLAPLTSLGDAKAERLLQTLHVYLDQQGSLSRTAEVLNLHRNAVAYRLNQVFSLLDVDRANPDDLLLLQLACRARKLG